MKKINIKKDLKFYTLEEVLKKASRSKRFQVFYGEELTRLKLAHQIKQIRTAKKLTQKSLSEKAKMPQSVIARLESGEHSFSLNTLQRVAQVFGKEVQLV